MNMGYTVVTAINLNDLINNVNRLVFQGWDVAGGIFKEEMVFMQAMYKPKTEDKKKVQPNTPATPRRKSNVKSSNTARV